LNQFPVNNRHKKSIDQESSLNFEGIALMENEKKANAVLRWLFFIASLLVSFQ